MDLIDLARDNIVPLVLLCTVPLGLLANAERIAYARFAMSYFRFNATHTREIRLDPHALDDDAISGLALHEDGELVLARFPEFRPWYLGTALIERRPDGTAVLHAGAGPWALLLLPLPMGLFAALAVLSAPIGSPLLVAPIPFLVVAAMLLLPRLYRTLAQRFADQVSRALEPAPPGEAA